MLTTSADVGLVQKRTKKKKTRCRDNNRSEYEDTEEEKGEEKSEGVCLHQLLVLL